jgi:hypothetical protein
MTERKTECIKNRMGTIEMEVIQNIILETIPGTAYVDHTMLLQKKRKTSITTKPIKPTELSPKKRLRHSRQLKNTSAINVFNFHFLNVPSYPILLGVELDKNDKKK